MTTSTVTAHNEQRERAERNRQVRHQHVFHIAEEYSSEDGFKDVAMSGGVKPPVAFRTPGRGAIRGKDLVDRKALEGCHLVQAAYIEPGNRKYLHHHLFAETLWLIVEGEGEYYSGPELTDVTPVKAGDLVHALPGQWHGMGNTGKGRLKYISIEGPQPYGGGMDETVVAE